MPRAINRRDIIKGSAALGLTAFAAPLRAAAPEPVAVTPALVEAARKEAKVILYSSMDLPVGEKLGRAFEAQYPGGAVQIERSGSERLFQRVDQEFASGIRAVDIINSSDASHFISWKKNGWLAPFVSEDVALSKQRVMQVQSSTDPPVARRARRDGRRQRVRHRAAEGSRTTGRTRIPERGYADDFRTDRHLRDRAASQCRAAVPGLHTRETQQFFIDFTAQYSVHAQVQSKPGRRKISDIKLMKEDAAGVEKMTDEIKTRYARLFRV